MRILVDENIPSRTVRALREAGHDVLDVRATPEEGASDQRLWEIARAERRLFITTDRGFARRREEPHPGMIIVLLRRPNAHEIHRRVMEALRAESQQEWPGSLVIMPDATRSFWKQGQQAP